MYLCMLALVFVVSLKGTTEAAYTINQENNDCPDRCYCEETKVNCTDLIPSVIPKNITEVVIFNPTKETLIQRAFCGVLWPDVSKLTLNSNVDDLQQDDLYLTDNLFNCLDRLTALKVQSEVQPVQLYRDSFAGLDSVTLLDFTGCSRILSEKIYIALSETTILPNLSRLILADVANAWGSFKVTQSFIDVLGYRNITEINFSSTTISFHVDDFYPLCDSLTKVNISRDFILDSDVNDSILCNSLRTVDVSGAHFPRSRQLPKHIKIANLAIDISRQTERHMYDKVSTLFANSLISRDHVISIINCSVVIPNNDALTEAHVTNYNVPHFDLKLKADSNNLTYLDLSSNSVETIGRHVFANLDKIMKLDLSNNRLTKCNSFDATFNALFQNNSELETLNLANNGLTRLPKGCFIGNRRLRNIDLSNNAFEDITFEFGHLNHLTTFDLKDNKIEYLDNTTMKALNHLYEMNYPSLVNHTQKKNQTLFVNLLGNPLKCQCKAMGFVEWFVRSPMFATTRHLYRCEADGHQIAINAAAVAEAKEDCERPERRRRIIILCSTIPTLCITTAVVVTYLVINKRRQRLANQQLEDTVKLIRNGDSGFQFPVFLSYSSENQAFVLNNILKPLQKNLRSVVGTDKDLVIIGDRYFRPGHSLFTEITRCLENCALVVAVMSLNYCKSIYCKLEIEQARIMGKPVIMVFIEDVDEKEMSEVMKEVFRNFTRVKIVAEGDGFKPEPGWPFVCQSIIQLL